MYSMNMENKLNMDLGEFLFELLMYPGSFILIKTLHMEKERRIETNPTQSNRILFNLGVVGLLVRSRMMNPIPPRENKKLEANPSKMYWPLTRYGMKATGFVCPCSSVVVPVLGGSTITSYMIPRSPGNKRPMLQR